MALLEPGTHVDLTPYSPPVHYINRAAHAHALVEDPAFQEWVAWRDPTAAKDRPHAHSALAALCGIKNYQQLLHWDSAIIKFEKMIKAFEAWKAGS